MDTVAANSDTLRYRQSNDSLLLSAIQQPLGQGFAMVVLRDAGSGSGLTGIWRYAGVTPANPLLDTIYKNLFFRGVYWSVSNSSIYQYASSFIADDIIAQLTTEGVNDTSTYGIVINRVTDCQVTLTGSITPAETVTIYGDASENIVFYSSLSAHANYTYYKNPSSVSVCPNNTRPDWWQSFLDSQTK